jgi:hypothetical protein
MTETKSEMKMKNNMTASALNGQVSQPLEVGNIVRNFGAIVRVDLLTDRGALVTIIPWMLNGIQQGGVGQRYYADPVKCERLAS